MTEMLLSDQIKQDVRQKFRQGHDITGIVATPDTLYELSCEPRAQERLDICIVDDVACITLFNIELMIDPDIEEPWIVSTLGDSHTTRTRLVIR